MDEQGLDGRNSPQSPLALPHRSPGLEFLNYLSGMSAPRGLSQVREKDWAETSGTGPGTSGQSQLGFWSVLHLESSRLTQAGKSPFSSILKS